MQYTTMHAGREVRSKEREAAAARLAKAERAIEGERSTIRQLRQEIESQRNVAARGQEALADLAALKVCEPATCTSPVRSLASPATTPGRQALHPAHHVLSRTSTKPDPWRITHVRFHGRLLSIGLRVGRLSVITTQPHRA